MRSINFLLTYLLTYLLTNFNGFRVLVALLHGTPVLGVSQTAALNRGCHLYSAGRPSRWALAHILVPLVILGELFTCCVAMTKEVILLTKVNRLCNR